MNYFVVTNNVVEGCHFWENADGKVEYLKYPHRHMFVIECEFSVYGTDREIEIFTMQDEIEKYITDKYGKPALFGGRSCEMIAEEIMDEFVDCFSCKVLEDGFGGAVVRREQ